MTNNPVLSDGGVVLRLVTEADAGLIVRLRNTPKGRILSRGAETVSAQVQWLREYELRRAAGLEYYFAIVNDSKAVGVVRIYRIDLATGNFVWGSWVIEEGTPVVVSLLTVRLVYDFAFLSLGLKKAQFDVRRINRNGRRFHFQMGATQVGEGELDVFFEYSAPQYQAARHRLIKWIESCRL